MGSKPSLGPLHKLARPRAKKDLREQLAGGSDLFAEPALTGTRHKERVHGLSSKPWTL